MLLSDNAAPASPEILDYICRNLQNCSDLPYGEDQQTQQLDTVVSEIFGTDTKVFPVLSGTAANCLALSAMCSSTGTIVTHRESHLCQSENTAPHFFTGGAALHRIGQGPDLISVDELRDYCCNTPWGDVHSALPQVLAIAQVSELGRAYSTEHLAELGAVCDEYGLGLYMDGARFANAVAMLSCDPADISWKAGVKALTFGAIKNGTFSAEALVVFDHKLYPVIRQKAKQAGHLASKMRYLSAQLIAYFSDELWLRNARNANEAAATLAATLQKHPECELAMEAQTNQLFVQMPPDLHQQLSHKGFELYPWRVNDTACYRLVTNWATDQKVLDEFECALAAFSRASR